MKICELFDNKYDWYKRKNSSDEFVEYRFITDPTYEYIVEFERELEPNRWNIDFTQRNKVTATHTYGITGSGNQYKIFATIIDIILNFKTIHNDAELVFVAIEPSRIKLYNRMVKTLVTKYNMTLLKKIDNNQDGTWYFVN